MKRWYKAGAALAGEIWDTTVQPGEAAFWFIGQCGFIFKSREATVMIDPVLNDITGEDGTTRRHYPAPFAPDAVKPDYVVCTHGHIDHLAGPTGKAIAEAFPDCRFLLPEGCRSTAAACGIPEEAVIAAKDGCCLQLPGMQVTAFSAAHPAHVLDDSNPDMALGYCLELDGIQIIHLGDTYLTQRLLTSLEGLAAPDIFLPPINGDDRFRAMRNCIGNMEAEEAAKLAVHLNADLSIPTHYDMIFDNNVDPLRFAAELLRLNPAAKWKIPALGERCVYRK